MPRPTQKSLENLVHFTKDQDREQARINGRKGGKASAEARARRKAFSEAFDVLLTKEYMDTEGKVVQGVDVLASQVFKAALNGDMKAFVELRASVGEAPVQRVETVNISQETYDAVEKLLGEEE